METKGFYSIRNHDKCLSSLFAVHLNTYGIKVFGHYKYFHSYSVGDRLYSSESDVYRRQILSNKVDPRAVRARHD